MEEYQTSSQLTSRLNRDRDVLWRGRVELTANGQGPMSIYAPYYFVEWEKDIEFLNAEALRPEVEVWASKPDGAFPETLYERHIKAPFMLVEPGTDNVSENTTISERFTPGGKTTGDVLNVRIALWSRYQDVSWTYFVTIFNRTVATSDGSLYPNQGSFT